MIIYCSECDNFEKVEFDENYYIECECGEQMIELSEDDLFNKIEDMQDIIYER